MRKYSMYSTTIFGSVVPTNICFPCRHRRSVFRAFFFNASSQTSPQCVARWTSPLRFTSATAPSFTESVSVNEENWDFFGAQDIAIYGLGACFNKKDDIRRCHTPSLGDEGVIGIPPERMSELNKLSKTILSHKPRCITRQLDMLRNSITRRDAEYLVVLFLRSHETDAVFKVYSWSRHQKWFKFDFFIATEVANYMGKEGRFCRCREIFDHIIDHGSVPSQTTFQVLIFAYVGSLAQGTVDEACNIYNRMIQLGGYQPHLDLHNSLFKALIRKQGERSECYLKQAEFIHHNLVTSELDVNGDIYAGLISLHSYQDSIDMMRIQSIREEMMNRGIEETSDVLLSVLRACSKVEDAGETERTWLKLLDSSDGKPPQLASIYRMSAYAKLGKPLKSLDIFREMGKKPGIQAYFKIIELLTKSQLVDLSESVMEEFRSTGLRPLVPSVICMMEMYLKLDMHDKLEASFFHCCDYGNSEKQKAWDVYLGSLVKSKKILVAETVFNQMFAAGIVHSRSCNMILSGYITAGEFVKAEAVYDLMCEKQYGIDAPLMEKMEYVLSLSRKKIKRPLSLKLNREKREMLVGLLLGGLGIESDEERRNHMIIFEFNEFSDVHSLLRRHLHNQFHEWLHPYSRYVEEEGIPFRFCTVSHTYFGFYADQFWPCSRFSIPNLIHRWMSPRALAYWYMYAGHRLPSDGVALRVKGTEQEITRVIAGLKERSIDCQVKTKGGAVWLGLLGSSSSLFLKLVEPFIIECLKDQLVLSAPLSSENRGHEAP